ncbi:MAG: ATP-binding protein [Candidatus Magnetoovum sp. WYHC-5]|nr:ATP-binding protein [Candidatus Magnetoovum sp. WYHC-5]
MDIQKIDKRYSILIVDDEPDILDALYDTFIDNYDVYKVGTSREALNMLRNKTQEIDLIISDQRMPEITGTELFKQVNSNFPSVGKILLTGYSDINTVVDAINKGNVDKYVPKPWKEEEILRIVLEVINKRLQKSIEERKRIESQLVQNAKLASLGELVAGIAHEINNPLSFINSNLNNLSKFLNNIFTLMDRVNNFDLKDNDKLELEKSKKHINYDYIRGRLNQLVERSIVGVERMSKIINDLKSFSRLDVSAKNRVNINDEIDITLNIMVSEFQNRITVIKEYDTLPYLECCASKLNQVFMNILINAAQAIEGKGNIIIRTTYEDNLIKVAITDTGKGIPENILDKIFDPFFTTKPVGRGTGLGLSISHGIIRDHNGEILVESTVGKGTTFIIKLPLK